MKLSHLQYERESLLTQLEQEQSRKRQQMKKAHD